MLIVNKRLIEKLKAKDELAFEQVYYEYEKLDKKIPVAI